MQGLHPHVCNIHAFRHFFTAFGIAATGSLAVIVILADDTGPVQISAIFVFQLLQATAPAVVAQVFPLLAVEFGQWQLPKLPAQITFI